MSSKYSLFSTAISQEDILTDLAQQISARQAEFLRIKNAMRKKKFGKHGNITVYHVNESKEIRFKRKSYIAVRVNI